MNIRLVYDGRRFVGVDQIRIERQARIDFAMFFALIWLKGLKPEPILSVVDTSANRRPSGCEALVRGQFVRRRAVAAVGKVCAAGTGRL